ncbi:site-specific integrase [Bradyrhizobium shewense]|uniref:site-specific integrase n=1 Tax=Bradyrhizobium shewense TaxID=1761772 RepID=UPI0013F61989|nr:site-specific integrase [Bradyrhizobium shewense]
MAALTYMQRRASGTYEFRKRLPETLAGKPVPPHMHDGFGDLINAKTGRFKRELVRSLQTKDLKEAKKRDHRAALQATKLFDEAIKALSPRDASNESPVLDLGELESEVFVELLGVDEAERLEGDDRRHLQTQEDRAKWPDLEPIPSNAQLGMSADHFHIYGELLPVFEKEFREAFARRDPKIVYPETNIALKRRGIYWSKASAEFQGAALVVLKAHVRAYEAKSKRQRGEIIPTPAISFERKEIGPKLSDALASWAGGGLAQNAKRPKANTITEAEQAVRYFKELHGDLRLGEITREKAREFRDAVAKVPSALPSELRKLPLPRLLERDLSGFKPRMATTVNKIMQVLGGIVSRAEREGFLDKVPNYVNPFGKAIRFSVDHHETARKHFDRSDLKAIFSSPVYSLGERPAGGGAEAGFWFPLVGLLSGMRLDEIAQLRIRDLRQDEDTKHWYFDINRTGGRSTKNASSIRHVPMHRELKRIGLLRYRQSLLKSGRKVDDPLWPAVEAQGQRTRSSAWSKWFGRYLRSTCGISDITKVFHSFRHTFKRMTRDAGLSEEMHDALTGHANSGSVGRAYGRGFSLGPLAKAMDQVAPPVDLSKLSWRGVDSD